MTEIVKVMSGHARASTVLAEAKRLKATPRLAGGHVFLIRGRGVWRRSSLAQLQFWGVSMEALKNG